MGAADKGTPDLGTRETFAKHVLPMIVLLVLRPRQPTLLAPTRLPSAFFDCQSLVNRTCGILVDALKDVLF